MCLDVDYDDEVKFETHTKPRARKAHKCTECGRSIEAGETYDKWTGLSYEGFWTTRMCAHCGATITLGCALTGCSRAFYWENVHSLDADEGGFVGDIIVNHDLSVADTVRVLRRVVQRRRQWRRPNGELYPLPQIPVAA